MQLTLDVGAATVKWYFFTTNYVSRFGVVPLATMTIQSGFETNKLDDSVAPSPTPSTTSLVEVVDPESEAEVDVDGSVAPTPTVKERSDLLQVCIYCHIIVMYLLLALF